MFIIGKRIKLEIEYYALCFLILLSLVFIYKNLLIWLILTISLFFISFLFKKRLIAYAIILSLFFEGNMFSFYFYGIRVRLVQIIEIIGIIIFLILLSLNKVRLKKTPVDFSLISYVAINFIAVINSLSLKRGLKIAFLLLSLALLYYLIANLLAQKIIFEKAFNLLLVAGLLIILFGLYQVLAGALNYYLNTNLPIGHSGISQAEFIGAPWGRPYSTFTEPDWYGAVCMFYSLLFIYLFLSKPQERRKFYFLGSVISVAGMFLSFVRASWIGFIAGIIFLIAIRLRIKAIKFKLKPLILILSAFFLFFLVLTLFSSTFGGIIKNRTSKTGEASISTENVRFKQMRQSLNIFLEHPVIGNGPGSFSLKGIWGNAENYYNGLVSEGKLSLDSRYDPGIITTVLADTGIIGAVFFLLFLFTFFKYNIDVVQKIDGYYQGVSMGLLIGIIGLFSSYILSTGLWMPFIWVFLGFNIASLNLGITEKEEAGIESTDAKQNQPA